MHLVLKESVVRWRLGLLRAQDGLLELGQLEAQLVSHLLGLDFIESLRLFNVDDMLEASIILVV